MMFIFWLVFGALIGFTASQKRGFSPVAGVLGGILLGPLAFFMFAVTPSNDLPDGQRKCPFCKEAIKADARVCKHCGKDVPAPRPVLPVRKAS